MKPPNMKPSRKPYQGWPPLDTSIKKILLSLLKAHVKYHKGVPSHEPQNGGLAGAEKVKASRAKKLASSRSPSNT